MSLDRSLLHPRPIYRTILFKPTAPVTGFAKSFMSSEPIADATITVLESGQQYKTNTDGRFGPIKWPIGSPITLVFEKEGYHKTQSATVIVPAEGLTGPLREISFQVPSHFAFAFMVKATGVTIDPKACQVTGTVTAFEKHLGHLPHGEAGVTVTLTPDTGIKPFYFGIFHWFPLKHKTNPFLRHLTETSADGGFGFLNVPPSEIPYTVTAKKEGIIFSTATFIANKEGTFINLSPPQGPASNTPEKEIHTENTKTNYFRIGLFATAAVATIAIGVAAYKHSQAQTPTLSA